MDASVYVIVAQYMLWAISMKSVSYHIVIINKKTHFNKKEHIWTFQIYSGSSRPLPTMPIVVKDLYLHNFGKINVLNQIFLLLFRCTF